MKQYLGQDKQKPGSSVVYWVRRPEYTDIFTQGYVGISSQPVRMRWEDHLRGKNGRNGILKNALRGGKDVVFEVVLVADSREYCEHIEELLRPDEYIGWNICKGGGKVNNKVGGQTNRLRIIKEKLADPNKACALWWRSEAKVLRQQALTVKRKARAEFVPYTKPRRIDSRNKLGLTGVSWYKPYSKWRAQIKLDDGPKFLGYFDDPHEAHRVYLQHKERRVADLRARRAARK